MTKKMPNTRKNPSVLFSALFLALLMTGCSNQSGLKKTSQSSANSTGGYTDLFGTYNPTNPSPTPNPGDFPDDQGPTDYGGGRPVPEGSSPAYTFDVESIGYTNVVTFKVQANKVLRVQFIPDIQNRNVEGTGFSPIYSHLAVFLAADPGGLSDKHPTTLLSNGLVIEREASAVIDLTKDFTHTCAADNLDCRQEVTVTVKKPNYNYWCYNWNLYCAYTRVYPKHPWRGQLIVETDDTQRIESNEYF
jgi:hypothetical protein